jgi:murein DD-endopeptidase MepM/ murein hydrolase activator NlpD
MKIRPTGPGKSMESGRFRTCVGSDCAPGSKAVRIEEGVLKGHHGIDLECKLGDPIFALFDGEFVETRFTPGRGYGRRVEFVSNVGGAPLYWGYSHLQNSGFFSGPRGRRVTAGQIVGYCGMTGYTSGGIHVHAETGRGRVFNPGTRHSLINPESVLTTTFDVNGNPSTPFNCTR